jgi:hypothetical protein
LLAAMKPRRTIRAATPAHQKSPLNSSAKQPVNLRLPGLAGRNVAPLAATAIYRGTAMKNSATYVSYRPAHGSNRPFARAITVLCALAMICSGCSTTRTLDASAGATGAVQPRPGDAVHLVLRDGQEMTLAFVEWNDEQLVGLDKNQQSQSVYRNDIVQMETTDKNAGLTKTLIIAGVVIVGGLLFFSAMEDAAAGALCC